MINLVLTAIFLILFINILYTFIFELKDRNDAYWRWKKLEIEYLSEVEQNQRFKRKPELIRYLSVMLDGFTIINLIYTILTSWGLAVFVQISMVKRQLNI